MKYYYAYYKDTDGKVCHQFTTDKDSLSPDVLYVTSFNVTHCNWMWALVEQYAIQTGDSISIENNVQYREWYKGTLWCNAHKDRVTQQWTHDQGVTA